MVNFVALFIFNLVFGVPIFCQVIGFMSPGWVIYGNGSYQGLFDQCCGNGSDTDNAFMNQVNVALGLEATSLALLLLTAMSLSRLLLSSGDDDNDGINVCQCLASFSLLMYPFAGLFTLFGCIVVVADKSASSFLGYSFYFALFAGCMIIFEVLVALIGWLVYRKCSHEVSKQIVSSSNTSVGRTSETMEDCIAVHEEVHASNGIFAIVRRTLVITKVVK